MTCPECGKHAYAAITGSAWGGPLSDSVHDRRATTYSPCGCVVEDDPIPFPSTPRPRA